MTDSFALSRTDIPVINKKFDSFHIHCQSHVGSVRSENQDYYGFEKKGQFSMLIVLDGMGGHSGGFEASRIACKAMLQHFESECSDSISPQDFLRESIVRGHNAILKFASKNPKMTGMGTTAVCLLLHETKCWIAHVGDSRAHIVRDKKLFQLTIDHTCVNQLALTGDLSLDDMKNHPMSHILDRSMGSEEPLEVEVYPEPIELQYGDRLILSSDGFLQYVIDDDITGFLQIPDLEQSAQTCINTSLKRGGSDNITVALLEFLIENTKIKSPIHDARTAFQAEIALAQQKKAQLNTPSTASHSLRVEYAQDGEFDLPPPPAPSSTRFYMVFAIIMMGLGMLLGSFFNG